ncbi:Type II secretion system protein F [bacterium HR35]|nr:Type II secretion system protein F [bacterium HR35]
MKVFRFKAYDERGNLRTGNLFLSSQEECLAFLLRNNLTAVEIKEIPENIFLKLYLKFFFRISLSQKIFLARNFYLILKSGLDLNQGLRLLMRETKGSLNDFLLYLSYNLQRGEPLYKIFASFPHIFSEVEVETIRAGEVSGNLAENFLRWVENLEKKREIRSEIIGNLIYPAIVLVMSLGVIFLLITFVMPKIGILIRELSKNPPFLTRFLLFLSDFTNQHLTLIITSFLLIIFILVLLFSLKRTRRILTLLLFRLPLFSKVYLYLALSDFLFILGSLLKAGISLPQALRLSYRTINYPGMKEAILNVEKKIVAGKRFGEALLEEKYFPPILANILGVASETGNLEETLKIMETYYRQEFRNLVNNFLTLLQPMLLIFVGLVVGFVAIAVLVPIYQQISIQLQSPGGTPGGF